MTRPRHPLGPQPGRLLAVMLRALIAELCEPRRYARAKEYARDDAVVDIDVRPRRVVGSVQGSRREPYTAIIEIDAVAPSELDAAAGPDASPGALNALLPSPDELAVACSCPDFEPGRLCKHAAAVLLVLADELSIEPVLLLRWRSDPDDLHASDGAPDDDDGARDVDQASRPATGPAAAGYVVRLPGRRVDDARSTGTGRRDASTATGAASDDEPAPPAPPAPVDVFAGTFELRRPLPSLPSPAPFDMVRWLAASAAGSSSPADELLTECVTALTADPQSG